MCLLTLACVRVGLLSAAGAGAATAGAATDGAAAATGVTICLATAGGVAVVAVG